MDKYLNWGIKSIIEQFPEIESVLMDYDIGCGPCLVGTCLLKDIVSIHSLPKPDEKELMDRISDIILRRNDPGKSRKGKSLSKTACTLDYSRPMQKLVDEHTLIKRWLALIPGVVESVNLNTEAGENMIVSGIDMIRSYADKFHHAKEEDILFKYFDESEEIIQVMYKDHTQARVFVQNMLNAMETSDNRLLGENLLAYRDLLSHHIKKEDEILYPWMDRQLTEVKIVEMEARFTEADYLSGITNEKYEDLVMDLEKLLA